ncbi:hypothetical protein SEA_GATTACA_10 [Mycobacterium phage Gattaca]|uniref:Uncharacterized protein n=1 Tax=Mycobacterium phage Gattaca TaxID=1852567 RepID=A0A192Y9X4_9CAUD|nr:hypothetical protein SEA_GATTACA_10 [Mycobacterium phage Gattaca]
MRKDVGLDHQCCIPDVWVDAVHRLREAIA